MQTLFKGSKLSTKNFISGGKKLGSSIVGAAKNNIVGFNKVAKSIIPQRKEEKENNFIKNYTNFFGSKKTEKILRKNLKLVRDSLVNTFEIARHLKAAIISITGDLKGKGGKGGGLFGGLGGLFGFLGGAVGLISGLFALLTNPWVLGFLGILAGGGILALLANEKLRKGIAEFMEPIILFLIRSELNPFRVNKGKIDDPLQLTAETINEIGESRTLAVLKDRLNELQENKPNFFTQHGDWITNNRKIKGLEQEIAVLENKGVESGPTSGDQFESDKSKFAERDRIRKLLNDMMIRETSRLNVGERNKVKKQIANDRGIKYSEVPNKDVDAIIFPQMEAVKEKYSQVLQYWEKNGKLPEGINTDDKKFKILESDINLNSSKTNVTPQKTNENVDGVKSDINSLDFNELFNLSDNNSFNFQPFTFDLSQGQDSSGGITNTSGGSSPSGNAVTFFPSSNSDPTYHKLNALMTFNII